MMTDSMVRAQVGPDDERKAMIKAVRLLTGAVLFCVGMLLAGFILFVYSIERTPRLASGVERADGIVVLTGARDRISRAVELLEIGKAHRLLITGVNRRTTRRALRRLSPRHARLFDCCIDIGYQALDTTGNADETRAWATRNRFDALIVVTSSYHMPRGLAELRQALPRARLIPFPVVTNRLRIDTWWSSPGTARLLAKEYAKFIPAAARFGVSRLVGWRGAAATTYADPSRLP